MKFEFAKRLTERQRRTFSERLIRLSNLIEALHPKQYAHESWITRLGGGCQTTACALGHAAVNPALFPGLDFRPAHDSTVHELLGHQPMELVRKDGSEASPEDADKYFGNGAFRAIFGGYAFNGSSPKKATVVNRIRQFTLERFGYEPA